MPIITTRLPVAMLVRLDKQLAKLKASVAPLRVTRADVMRRALELGLAQMEKRKR